VIAAIAVLVAWATNQAGYPQTHWAPGGLILLALLAIAIGATGLKVAAIPRLVQIAIGALAAYTALSFVSIMWAKVPGDAFEGADRTLVYLVVFTLFAGWRRSGASAALLLGAWALAISGLAVFAALHVNAATGSRAELQSLMPGGRLTFPAGYTNANAALWMIAFFPAWILASERRAPALLRGLLAGGAVVLADVALYSQSRGSVYSIPIVLALVFLFLPGRVRSFATLLPIAAGAGACVPAVLRMDERLETHGNAVAAVHSATTFILLAAVIVASFVAAAAWIERRSKISEAASARASRGIAAVGILAAVAVVAGGLIAVGDPIAKIKHEWHTFASQHGYAADETGKSRLVSGLGSGRSDFYRVALNEFSEHPLLGIGADNFAVPYLRLRHTNETPHYPHSVELRTLVETGLIGALIALFGISAALLGVRRALRGEDRLAATVAAAAVAGFAYWVVHGSFDWFFEYAGLGACAFALLGLACSVTPRRLDADLASEEAARSEAPDRASAAAGRSSLGRRVAVVTAALATIAAAVAALALPWLSRLEVESAAKVWTAAPAIAYERLAEAARLNPLSDEANVVAGTIALRLGELRRAQGQFRLALDRSPEDAYATLELGAIASSLGERNDAMRRLQAALLLDPRSVLAKRALATVSAGQRVNIADLNRSILSEAQQFS
jgi:tetratricopeptide (TPR) repeat protein